MTLIERLLEEEVLMHMGVGAGAGTRSSFLGMYSRWLLGIQVEIPLESVVQTGDINLGLFSTEMCLQPRN